MDFESIGYEIIPHHSFFMIFNEQNLKKFKRSYFRGLKSSSERIYKETYLTTKFQYALFYAKATGQVFEYKLKENANIFNAKCKTDEGILRRYCQKNWPEFLSKIEKLKNNDWITVSEERQDLIDAIQLLGYDGYFNFEIDKNLIKEARKYECFDFTEIHLNSPSIALFDDSSLIEVQNWKGEKLERNQEFQALHEKELDYIKWSLLEDLYEGFEKSLKQKTEELSKGLVTFKNTSQIAEYIQTFKKSPIENIKDLEDEFGPLIQEEYERRLSLAKSMSKRLHLSEENLISKVKKPFYV